MAPSTRANPREEIPPEGVDRGVRTSNPIPGDELTSFMAHIMGELKELRANQTSLFEKIVSLKEAHPSRTVTPKIDQIPHHAFAGNNGEEEDYEWHGDQGGGNYRNGNGVIGRRGNRGPENYERRNEGGYVWNGRYGRDRYYEEEKRP